MKSENACGYMSTRHARRDDGWQLIRGTLHKHHQRSGCDIHLGGWWIHWSSLGVPFASMLFHVWIWWPQRRDYSTGVDLTESGAQPVGPAHPGLASLKAAAASLGMKGFAPVNGSRWPELECNVFVLRKSGAELNFQSWASTCFNMHFLEAGRNKSSWKILGWLQM